MNLTDWLLLVLCGLVVGRLVQAHIQHRALIRWLDALGDMLGDMLRGISDSIGGDQR